MKDKLQITEGRVSLEVRMHHILVNVSDAKEKQNIADFWFGEDTRKNAIANAKLFSDAHNTYNQHPVLPSDLLQQNRELVEMLEVARSEFQHIKDKYKIIGDGERFLYQSNKLLTKHSKDV